MRRTVLKSKLHRAVVTATDLDYHGSLTLDPDLAEAADLVAHERVQVVNMNTGARFDTYVIIAGERGRGDCRLNGGCARLASVGDEVLVLSWVDVDDDAARTWQPRVLPVERGDTAPNVPGKPFQT